MLGHSCHRRSRWITLDPELPRPIRGPRLLGVGLPNRTTAWATAQTTGGQVGILAVMATQLRIDPELQAIVERAREQARRKGELRDEPWAPDHEPLPADARAVLRDWVTSGDYDRAVSAIVANDPDLATE